MAKSSFGEMRGRSEMIGLDIPVEPGLECGFMTRPPGSCCGTSKESESGFQRM